MQVQFAISMILADKNKVLIATVLLSFGVAFSAKLLRVPKIYNALITSKEKILPSEAYPGTTGPLFQPIGLPGETLLIHPEFITRSKLSDEYNVQEGDEVKLPFQTNKKTKIPQPLTFFPRYSLYYANQPHLILQHPFLYTPLEFPTSVFPQSVGSSQFPKGQQLETEEQKDLSLQKNKQKFVVSSSGLPEQQYVKNNKPANSNIPDIPPPPPPIRYVGVEGAEAMDNLRGTRKELLN